MVITIIIGLEFKFPAGDQGLVNVVGIVIYDLLVCVYLAFNKIKFLNCIYLKPKFLSLYLWAASTANHIQLLVFLYLLPDLSYCHRLHSKINSFYHWKNSPQMTKEKEFKQHFFPFDSASGRESNAIIFSWKTWLVVALILIFNLWVTKPQIISASLTSDKSQGKAINNGSSSLPRR